MILGADKYSSSLKEKLTNLPSKSGVYKFIDKNGRVLYIGKAINLRNRVRQYFSKSGTTASRIAAMTAKVYDVELIITDSEVEALILEATLIKKLKPHYNIDLKDDKSYPYIIVTNEPYPRVLVTRQVKRDGSKYFGPYTDVKNMRSSLKMIRDIFKVRSCNYHIDEETIRKRKIKVCLDFHIKKCDGPCEGMISHERYNSMIDEVTQVIKGKYSSLLSDLEEKMNRASQELKYEEAADLRDKIKHLNVYKERQKVIDVELTDRDIFAVASEGDDACGVVFNVREGKIVNRKHIYMNGVQSENEAEVLEQFLERYYLETEDIPSEIFLPIEVNNMPTIQEWLSKKSEENTNIKVPKIGEKAKLIGMCWSNAKLLLEELKIQKHKQYIPHSVSSLQRDIRLPKLPRRIECFDISNIQGTDSVASMVVFIDGKPKKSEYRRYKIESVYGPDDFASIREVIKRRYEHLEEDPSKIPNLIVVDGGKGQLSSAVDIINNLGYVNDKSEMKDEDKKKKRFQIIGLAKKLEEVFIPNVSEPITIPRTSSGLRLLQRIRNEAHRFAIEYHRTLRKKRVLQTELEVIAGIGKKRAIKLLNVFGSVQGVKSATYEQLKEVVGEDLAENIKNYYQD